MNNLKRIAVLALAGILTISQCNITSFAAIVSDDKSENEYISDSQIKNETDDINVVSENDIDILPVMDGEGVALDEEHFPEKDFRDILEIYDNDKNAILSDEEIKKIESIAFSDNVELETLDGINFLTNLKSLSVTNQRNIDKLDLSNNTELISLKINNLPIDTLDLSKNKKLAYIDVRNTYIEEIGIQGLENVVDLILENNKLKSIDVSDKKYLNKLKLEDNEIKNLDLSNNKLLIYLDVRENRLKELDLSNNKELKELYIHGNGYTDSKIENLDVSQNVKLKYLYCNDGMDNKSLDLSNNEELLFVDVLNNNLEYLDVSNCPELQCLNVSNNKLVSIDLSNNKKLRDLNINVNNLTSLDLSLNENLEYVYCASNKLKELIICHDYNLNYLYCSNNELEELDVSDCPNLTYLKCSSNNIIKLNLSNDKRLGWLYIDDNKLSEIDISSTSVRYADESDFEQSGNIAIKISLTDEQYDYIDDKLDFTKDCFEAAIVDEEYYEINETNFEDEKFRELIKEYDKNKDGKLSHIEISMVKDLYINNKKISSLKGIDLFFGLQAITSYSTTIKSVDLSNNYAIERIEFANNELSDINVSNCSRLKSVSITYNNLKEIDLSDCSALEYIEFSDNEELEKLILPEDLCWLNVVKIYNTSLSELNLLNAINLMILDVRQTNITDLQMMNCYTFLSEQTLPMYFNAQKENAKEKVKVYVTEDQYNYLQLKGMLEDGFITNVEWVIHNHVNDQTWYCIGKNHYQKCSICNEKISKEEHTPELVPGVESTCTKSGLKEYYKCKCGLFADAECNNQIKDIDAWKIENIIPPKGHAPVIVPGVPSTCVEAGIESYYKCVCGYYEDKECTKMINDLDDWKKNHRLPLADHTWDKGKITIQPTFFENGVCTYTCDICGALKTEDIKRLEIIEIPIKGKYDIKPAAKYLLAGKDAANAKKYKYKVDNKKIAAISSRGILKAKKDGVVKVTVYARNAEKKYEEVCSIDMVIKNTTVEKKRELTSLDQSINLNQLVTNVPNGYDVKFELSKSNAKKASLDNGVLKPVKAGTIMVKCIIGEGKYALKKSIKVVVKLPKANKK